MSIVLPLLLVLLPFVLFGYAYFAYPAILRLMSRQRDAALPAADPAEWPAITIAVPAYNEEKRIRETIEALLALDYPSDKRQIVIMSDASSDGTDAIVQEYAGRGIE